MKIIEILVNAEHLNQDNIVAMNYKNLEGMSNDYGLESSVSELLNNGHVKAFIVIPDEVPQVKKLEMLKSEIQLMLSTVQRMNDTTINKIKQVSNFLDEQVLSNTEN